MREGGQGGRERRWRGGGGRETVGWKVGGVGRTSLGVGG